MKKAMKKLLCLVLVLMIAIPFAAFPASAETGAEEIEPLYTVNFVSTDTSDLNTVALVDGWDGGLKYTPNGSSATLSNLGSNKWANRSAALKGVNLQGSAYTLVFTVTAGDNDEEVGLLLDHQTGFVVNPAKNTFRFTDHRNGGSTFIETTEYDGTGDKKQTYAIEIADQGSGSKNGQPIMDLTTYKLYNLTVDETGKTVWNLACSLSAEQLDPSNFDWGSQGDCDDNLYVRFSRDRKNYSSANSGSITISNFTVYEDLVVDKLVVETRAYYLADDGDLLYTANFNGDDTYTVGTAWAGMDQKKVVNGGNAIILKPTKSSEAAAFGKEMNTTHYPAKGNSYTMAFTVTASDKDQEIGLYPDWSSGFVVVPGKNQFKYNKTLSDRTVNETIVDYTDYDGTGSLTQTYAIEYQLNDDFSCAEYNLYVAQNGKWVLLYSLDAEELAAGPNWSETDYETVIRFYRDSKIANQNGTVVVSNVNVYKGLAAKSGKAAAPANAVHYTYGDSTYGDMLLKPTLSGDGVFVNPTDMWTGIRPTYNSAGTTVTLRPWNVQEQAAAWGGNLRNYSVAGKSYTAVFHAKIGANEQEIAFMPDGRTGFVISPAFNSYRFVTTFDEGITEEIVTEGTYAVTKGEWDQTFAVEWKVDDDYNVVAYNLYISYAGEWVCICKLTAEQLASLTAQETEEDSVMSAWNANNNQVQLVFMCNQPIKKDIVISNVAIYKGLVATTGLLAADFTNLAYDKAENGDKLYDVNFQGTNNVFTGVKDVYDGMNESFSDGGYAINLKPNVTPSESGSVYGGELKAYTMPGSAYTVVFTVEAADADQSVGVFLKWKDGFVITPGKNEYYVGHTQNNADGGTAPIGSVYGIKGTYNGTGALKQTYAIEIASGDVAGSDNKYECTVYNLYVLQDGVWVLVCSLDADQRQQIAWNTTDPEFMIHLARISEADGDNAGRVTVSDMSIYKGNNMLPKLGLVDGAAVRIANPSGIRFTGSVDRAYYDALVAQYGAENVQLGILITPTDYLVDNGLAFTKEALDACNDIPTEVKYLEIDAKVVLDGVDNKYYTVNCAMVDVNEANYQRNFSARMYIKVNGEIVEYSAYNLENNSRNIAEVAEKAYNDVQTDADDVYTEEITLDTGVKAYSPYTAEERKVLEGFFPETASPSITVMTYNIRTYGDADSIWESIFGTNEGWDGRDPDLALETIIELMPDVVGLQEDDENLYDEYKDVPEIAQYYERLNANGNGNEGNEIMYKKDMFTLIATGTERYKELAKVYADEDNVINADFSVDTKGDNEVGRFFRWAILEKDGVQFLVVNTHLHYTAKDTAVSDAVNKNLRKAQATLIRLWLAEMASTCSNQIVMGDMNAQGDSQEMKYGLRNGTGSLDLAADNAIIKVDVGGTLVSEGFVERQPWVYDHIFFSGETLIASEYAVVDNYDVGAPTNYPSDHLPVVAKFICK